MLIHVCVWLYGVIFRQFHPIFTKDLAEWELFVPNVTPTWQTGLVILKNLKHIRITNLCERLTSHVEFSESDREDRIWKVNRKLQKC